MHVNQFRVSLGVRVGGGRKDWTIFFSFLIINKYSPLLLLTTCAKLILPFGYFFGYFYTLFEDLR